MAQLLIKAVDVTHVDPIKDMRGCYKSGDVVVVQPDNHVWGAKEGLPNFVVLSVPGAVGDFAFMLDPVIDGLNGDIKITRRRANRFDPLEVARIKASNNGKKHIALAAFNQLTRKKP